MAKEVNSAVEFALYREDHIHKDLLRRAKSLSDEIEGLSRDLSVRIKEIDDSNKKIYELRSFLENQKLSLDSKGSI